MKDTLGEYRKLLGKKAMQSIEARDLPVLAKTLRGKRPNPQLNTPLFAEAKEIRETNNKTNIYKEQIMKTTLWVLLFLCTSMLCGEVLFYDDFNRAEGSAVGNGWTNIGPVSPIIENGTMKIVSSSLQGVRRDFNTLGISSGIYCLSYDWKISANNWLADIFPNGTITYIRHDYEGNLYYDNTSDFSNPIQIGTLAMDTWANFKLKVNLDTDRFSLWINDTLVADNIAGNAIDDFTRITFRAGSGSNVTQYVDNIIVYNDIAPEIPTDLTATGTINDITLNWTGVSQDFLSYKIYRNTNSPADAFLAEIPGTQTTYTDNTAEANTDYYYRVKALSMATIESGYSNEVMAHLQPHAIVNPTNITFNVGYGYSYSTSITIENTGNYPLDWSFQTDLQADTIPTEGLIANYAFSGDTINETGTTQYDGINHGAVFTTDRFDNPNSALDFNGTSSYLSFPQNIEFTDQMAISCWVTQRSVSYAPGIISRHAAWSLSGDVFGSPGVRFYPTDFAWGIILAAPFDLNTWHHIVATVDFDSEKLYIDGILRDENPYRGVGSGGNDMFVGKYYSGEYFWDGIIDDIRIYNRGLAIDEVSLLFQENNPTSGFSISPSGGTVLSGDSRTCARFSSKYPL